jgi:hypothetical protein
MSELKVPLPAFPQVIIAGGGEIDPITGDEIAVGQNVTHSFMGITIRDYFAANAMQACVSAEYAGEMAPSKWAASAYLIADAMLKAREV